MIEKILALQFGGFYGGDIGNLLSYWEQMGFFSYILPFLLIFALIFGILTKTKIFKDNKPVNAIIALAIGLLALQFDFVPLFFSEIFPRLGIGLAVILALLILVGLFAPSKSEAWTHWIFFGAAFIIFIVVLVQTFGWLGWSNTYLWNYNWPWIITIAVVLGFFIWIISQNPGQRPKRVEMKFPGPPVYLTNDGNN
jgi:hypothetical protein